MSDIVVADSALERDRRFERLVDQHQLAVLHMCYLYLCDKTLAEDATQETFLKVYRNMDSFRGDSSEKTWIMKIAMRTCYDMNHSTWLRFRRCCVILDTIANMAQEHHDDDAELVAAVTRLPLKLRQVILLRYYQDMKVNDIAAALGITQSAVSERLRRGRQKLKDLLEGREIDE